MSADSERLEDMAVAGTTIPSDSAKPRYIKSVPRPDQIEESANVGGADLAGAATNDTDMPRRNKDIGFSGEVVTGTGDQLPADIESKRLLHLGANEPLAKGQDRYHKHHRQQESDLERFAGDGAEVDAAPGEEEEDQDTIRSRKGLQGGVQ